VSRDHLVTIQPDWSRSTPHDIGLERVAMATGGYLSCVDLVDHEVPALRELLQLRARRVVPEITRAAARLWRLGDASPDCRCRSLGFGTAADVAEHARDPFRVPRVHWIDGTGEQPESSPLRRGEASLYDSAHPARLSGHVE